MPRGPDIDRRRILRDVTLLSSVGLAGCLGGGEQRSTPEEDEADDPTEAPSTTAYDPAAYYGLPKCDGTRPIQLLGVNNASGIVRNRTAEAKLVLVYHDSLSAGASEGPRCSAHYVPGGAEVAYETLYENKHPDEDPDTVGIKAVDPAEEGYICDTLIPYQADEYTDGCVDPDAFREIPDTEAETPAASEPVQDAQEAAAEETTTALPTIENVVGSLVRYSSPETTTPTVQISASIKHDVDSATEVSFTFVVETEDERLTATGSETLQDRYGTLTNGIETRIEVPAWHGPEATETEVLRQFEAARVYVVFEDTEYEATKRCGFGADECDFP